MALKTSAYHVMLAQNVQQQSATPAQCASKGITRTLQHLKHAERAPRTPTTVKLVQQVMLSANNVRLDPAQSTQIAHP
jgi:hypothetical protein